MNFNPTSPTKYRGTDQYLVPVVTRNYTPTVSDYRQPETGRNYVIGTIWQVGVNTTDGTYGDLYMLSKIVSNQGIWIPMVQNGTDIVQYAVLVGGADNEIESVGPSTMAGQILQSGGSTANPLYSTATYSATAGTSGQILTSNGTGFFPQDAATDGSSLVLIASQTASSSASLIFTGLTSDYSVYLVQFSVTPATGGQNLNMNFSLDGGATYLGSGLLCGLNYNSYNSATATNVNSTSTGPLAIAVSSISTCNGSIFMYNLGNSESTMYSGTGVYFDTAQRFCNIFGSTGSNTVINALKFSFASGNIAMGTISIYGLSSS